MKYITSYSQGNKKICAGKKVKRRWKKRGKGKKGKRKEKEERKREKEEKGKKRGNESK